MSLNRVVITGRGAVSPFGIGVKTLCDNIWRGHSGVKYMPEWKSIKGLNSYLAAPVPSFDPRALIPRKNRRTMGLVAMYALLATREALTDAAIAEHELGDGKIGVAIGSTSGSPSSYTEFFQKHLVENKLDEIRSGLFFKVMGHTCSANVALALGLTGEQWAPTGACASSSQAIGLGYLLIRFGRQEIMLCGGAEETNPIVTAVFDVIQAASHRHESVPLSPRPFDIERDGVVCGGGSGILVLESLISARKRGATIYGEILGFGHVNDSHHMADPHQESLSRAMRQALSEQGVEMTQIDLINAHATGTLAGDIAEAGAIRDVFGSQVPVNALKGHLGHSLGAAGSLESIVLLEMMQRQEVVPTLHLTNPDPRCGALNYVRAVASQPLNTVVKNNFALGGIAVTLIYGRLTQ